MKNMKTICFITMWRLLCLAVLLPVLNFSAFAGEALYSLTAPLDAGGLTRVNYNISTIDRLSLNTVVDVAIPSQQTVSGVVERTVSGASRLADKFPQETSRLIISLANNAGALELIVVNKTITGMILHDATNRTTYRAVIDGNGRGVLRKEDTNAYQCLHFPVAADISVSSIPKTSDLIPSEVELQNLESRPGAAKTLYLNYWGGTLSGTAWNDNYNSGNDIIYTPYSADGDTANFSSNDRYNMWLGWQEAAEDYATFDINITTKQSVYDATPIANRSQMIATTTNYFYPGAGGVAYVGVFNNGSDYYKTAWTWNSGAGSLGMTISHEGGHNMGLGHDGTSTLGYYSGHGVWGPIMGAPFNQEYVQWSKGDYNDANNSENDLATIAAVLGSVIDDAGDTNATATPVALPVVDHEGQIRPDGISPDIDVYSLSLSGTTHVEVSTLFGDEGEQRAANLAMNVTLKDSSGTVVASMTSNDYSPLDPTTNTFVFDGSLASGTYYLTIDAVSPDTNWSTGFDEYANEGVYRLTISSGALGGPAISVPVPGSTLSGASEYFTWSDNGTTVDYYWLAVGTTGVNSHEILNANMGSSTSTTVAGLPTDGSTIYVRLSFRANGQAWSHEDYTYTAASTLPEIITPISGSTLSGASEVFNWSSNGASVDQYWLSVGTTGIDSRDILYATQGTATSATISGLPVDGSTIYVRLWFEIGGSWGYEDYTYTAAILYPEMTSPVPGSTLSGVSEVFTWSANGTNADQYWLSVGTTGIDSRDVLYANQGASTSTTVTGLPSDTSTVYVRLWYKINGTWGSEDYTYTATCGATGIISPVPGSTLTSGSETFNWCDSGASSKYWLHVGSSAGAKDIHDSGDLGTTLSTTVSGLPFDGSTVYVRFWYYVGAFPLLAEGETLEPSVQAGSWFYEDYTYTAVTLVGFDEQFNGDISNWDFNGAAAWSNYSNINLYANGANQVDGTWATTTYNPATYSDLDYTVRLWRNGTDTNSNNIMIRSDNTYLLDGLCSSCYIFQYSRSGFYSIFKLVNGSVSALQGWTASSAINQGSAWNDIRVVAQGANLSFYINNTPVWTGADSDLVSGRVGVNAYKATSLDLWIDWAVLGNLGSAPLSGVVSQEQQLLNQAANQNPLSLDPRQTPNTGAAALPNILP